MLKMYFLIAIRHFYKHRSTTLINVVGLSIGLIALMAIYLFVHDEKSFDSFHTKKDHIYRLWDVFSSNQRETAIVPYKWTPYLIDELSEVITATTFDLTNLVVRKQDDVFNQDQVLVADSLFFDVFDFPLLAGNRYEVLRRPNDLLLTPTTAASWFGSVEAALGAQVEVSLFGHFETYEVIGIVDCPGNSHIQFNMIISFHHYKAHSFNASAYDNWSIHFVYTYMVLAPDIDRDLFKAHMAQFLKRHQEGLEERYSPNIQPLDEIYLESTQEFDFTPRGDRLTNDILLLVGWMIMIIAVINYVNLSTAHSISRTKEVGIRKVFGSTRKYLMGQFLIESWLISLLSLLLALLVMILLLPFYNDFVEKQFAVREVLGIHNLIPMFCFATAAGLLGGLYPALVLSKHLPCEALKTSSKGGHARARSSTRFGLVVLQFVVAILLIAGSVVMLEQIEYMLEKDLGYDMEQTIVVNDAGIISGNPLLRERLRNVIGTNAAVQSISVASSYPGLTPWSVGFIPEGDQSDVSVSYPCIFTDNSFVTTYNMQLIKGRNFYPNYESDTLSFLVSEEAVRVFAVNDSSWLRDPIGKDLECSYLRRKGKVMGVFKDIHFETLHHDIKPLILLVSEPHYLTISMRLKTNDMETTLAEIEGQWKYLFPEVPFDYGFADQRFEDKYGNDRKLHRLLTLFSAIAVLIAAIGLFGLSIYLTKVRRKEISIRKVMGAKERVLIVDQTMAFIRLAILSNVIAFPLVLIFTNAWLSSFAYRIKIPLDTFLWTFLITVAVTVLTTAFEAAKTARSNPARVLAVE